MPHHHRRARVGPLQVIQHQQHRRPGRHSRKKLRRGIQQPEPLLVRLQDRWRGQTWQQHTQPRRDPRQRGPRHAKISLELPQAHQLAVTSDRLGERAERRHPHSLRTAASQHHGRAGPRRIGQLPQRVGLADPRLTGQQNHPAPARGRVVKTCQQARDLTDTAEIPRRSRLPRPRLPCQAGRLLQDRPMKATQLSARIDTQVLPEDLPHPAERVQGPGLPPVAVQRDHQLAPPPLTQRAASDEGLETAHHLVMAAKRELGIEQILQRRLAQFVQPQRLRGRERPAGELSQRRTSPQAQRPPQQPGGPGGIAASHLLAGLTDQALRQYRVDHAWRSLQAITIRQRHDGRPACPGQRAAHAKHVILQRLRGRPGRIIRPQRIHQPASTDSVPAAHRQCRQQATLLDTAQRDRSLARQLHRTEDADPPAPWRHLHRDSMPRTRSRGLDLPSTTAEHPGPADTQARDPWLSWRGGPGCAVADRAGSPSAPDQP